MKPIISIILSAFFVMVALPAHAMDKDNQFCSLPLDSLNQIAASLDWKDISAVQKTCTFFRDKVHPLDKEIMVDFSNKRGKTEDWCHFFARVLTKLAQVKKYPHNNKIILRLDHNYRGNYSNYDLQPALARFIADICKMGLADRISGLDLADNNIQNEIIYLLSDLKNLTCLNLADNNLSEDAIEKVSTISSLEELYLRNNGLRHLPKCIGSMSKLRVLWLHNNNFPSVEIARICQLPNLQELYIGYNNWKTLPPEIQNLQNLQFLWAPGNKFDENELGIITSLLPQDCIFETRTAPQQ